VPALPGFDLEAVRALAGGEGDVEAGPLLRAAGIPLHDGAPPVGADVRLRAVADPDLGPLVGVGTGGPHGAFVDDLAYRLAPLTDVDAEELIAAPPAVRAALDGAHGGPRLDAAALRDVVLRLGALADALPALTAAELDPVRVTPDGAWVLDAHVSLAPPPERRRAKTW
jgi:hypothetical protein